MSKRAIVNIIIVGIFMVDAFLLSPIFFKVFTNCPLVEDKEVMTREEFQLLEVVEE